LLGVQGWCALRAARGYRGLPVVAAVPAPAGSLPPVSIIVPARDEAENLRRLLPSLNALRYPAFEIIVVDDSSTDETATVARALGARVVEAGPLPPGWAGKPHACVAGVRAALHQWLLFTDADTEHAPKSLAAVLSYVAVHDLEALSAFCGQRCESVWERLLLPYAFRHFFAGVDAASVNRPDGRQALANGQYVLLRREVYERTGGHGAVRYSIAEDVALALLLKRCGVRYRMVRAESLVRVRMYHGLGAIRRGFAKNSSRFLAQDRGRGALVVLSTLADGAALALIGAGIVRRDRGVVVAGLASWLVGAAGLAPWMHRFGVPRRYATLQPLAAGAFQVIALEGLRALRPGGTEWKGRRY
jgi:chlorobactene glucosyltransferase